MRMSSRQHSRRRPTSALWLGASVCVFLVLFFFARPLGFFTSTVVTPLASLRVWFLRSEASVPRYLRGIHALEREVASLESALGEATYDKTRLKVLEAEERLRAGLGTRDGRIVADVLRRPNEIPYDTLLIQKGANDGVVERALVYGNGGTVIGFIARVFSESALVVLFTSSGIASPVYVLGADVFAHAEGMGGGVLRVSVPQGIALRVGDPVVYSIKGSGIFGTIDTVVSETSDPEQYGFITMRPSLFEIRFVTVDTSPIPDISYTDAESIVMEIHMASTTQPFQTLLLSLPTALSTTTTEVPRAP